jgi:uncharacterized Zn-finger protein
MLIDGMQGKWLMSNEKRQACTQKYVEITSKDLPLSCPLPNERLWDAHPRVYLPIEKSGKEICPYCGTTFILIASNEK